MRRGSTVILLRHYMPVIAICLLLALNSLKASAQVDSSAIIIDPHSLSTKTLRKLNDRYHSLTETVNKRSARLLQKIAAKEENLQQKDASIDSSNAAGLFSQSVSQYQQLQNKLNSKEQSREVSTKKYLPGLDSMQTALSFLQQEGINLPVAQLQQIRQLSQQLKQLQASMGNAEAIEEFVKQRERLLKTQLSPLGFNKQLLGINKEVYYYQQELSQYRDIINSPDKTKEAILSLVSKVPAFRQYWQKYSILAQLFPLPENYGTSAALAGLQTNAQVAAMLQQRMGAPSVSNNGGGNLSTIPQQYVQQAQEELNQRKDKVMQAGGNSGDMTLPDFKPDGQHGKSFLKRLHYGFNMQAEPAHSILPSITDLALTIGFKFNDKIEAGFGTSYKLGMGTLKCIHFSSEGIGARSYVDIKARGSIWITGSWEYNYLQSFQSLRELHNNVNLWQKSALAGITKKYKMGKKEGNMQLLYDFLAGQQRPVAQPLKFRIGYGL